MKKVYVVEAETVCECETLCMCAGKTLEGIYTNRADAEMVAKNGYLCSVAEMDLIGGEKNG